jgi:hypothetical protein
VPARGAAQRRAGLNPSRTGAAGGAQSPICLLERQIHILLQPAGRTGRVEGDTLVIVAPDDFALGVAAARTEMALHSEGLTSTLTRSPAVTPSPAAVPSQDDDLTPHSSVLIVFQ